MFEQKDIDIDAISKESMASVNRKKWRLQRRIQLPLDARESSVDDDTLLQQTNGAYLYRYYNS